MAIGTLEQSPMKERSGDADRRQEDTDISAQQNQDGQTPANSPKNKAGLTPEEYYKQLMQRPDIRQLMTDLATMRRKIGKKNQES